ncbi:Uncharacterized protein BM_BM14729 [Brugia malayi]|uniref:Bm14729 n=1 Tax=Brugia malayi TaxID=6279 RepID=A0A4E9FR93_BRUMA|nr:Uncharacterized protein BM_BM14729 [Brugia malayi]VIO99227.1 Uncharacterized protein BM_BM14729 [Brugia malayi]
MADNLKESSVFRIQKTDVTGPDELITPVEDLKESQKTTNLLVTKTTEIIKNEQPSSISKKVSQTKDQIGKILSNTEIANKTPRERSKLEKKDVNWKKCGIAKSEQRVISKKLDKTDKTISLDHKTISQMKTDNNRSFPDANKMIRKITDETTGTLTIQNVETKSNQSIFPASSGSELRLNSRNETFTDKSQSSNKNLLITHPISNKIKKQSLFLQWSLNIKSIVKKLLINLRQKLLQNFHYFKTEKVYELFPFLIVGHDDLDYDLPMLYVTEMIIPDEDDLDTDEDRLDRMQMEDHGVSWVDTPDKIPVCMQIVNASMWKPFLPQTRSPAHNR